MSSEKIENYEKYAKKLLDDGKKLVCVTHAEKGASLIDDSGVYNIQANKLQVVDTNGAGDNFFAGFLYGYLNQYSPKDCLYLGRIAAESCVMSNKIVSDDLSNNYLVENYKKLKNIVEKLYDIV
jgi:sugar/nucleoside kinase (ribokinase family)